MIEFKLTMVDRGIVYECLKMDERLRCNLKVTVPNGIEFVSDNNPEISHERIWVFGKNSFEDNRLSFCYFNSNFERDEFIEKVKVAFEDFRKWLKEKYPNDDKKKQINEHTIIFSAYE